MPSPRNSTCSKRLRPTTPFWPLDKVLGAVADQYRQKLSGYRNKLQELESHHGMSTDVFLQRFEAGALGDADEWFDWEAIAALKTEAERKLGELERAGV